jgi:hypothetical protein
MFSDFLVNRINPSGIVSIGIVRRAWISFFQWISNFVCFVMAVMAIVDISLANPRPDYYVYYTSQSAGAAGYPFQGSHIGWIPYIVLQSIAVFFICLAAIIERRCCISFKTIGTDLSWDIFPFKQTNLALVKKTIWQAQNSFSPHGACYNNYFYYAPLVEIVVLIFNAVHVFFGFDIIAFTPIYATYGFILFVILSCYMFKTYFMVNREIQRYKRLEAAHHTLIQ